MLLFCFVTLSVKSDRVLLSITTKFFDVSFLVCLRCNDIEKISLTSRLVKAVLFVKKMEKQPIQNIKK